ncbi:MAG: zinc-dependent alcohol dehydrogenase [Bacteroidota bacterium]
MGQGMEIKIPDQMRALVLESPTHFEVKEVPVPKPGRGEVLCRVRAVAICGSDPEIVFGGLAGIWPPSYPFIPGHEWCGEVVSLGEGVHTVTVGDHVAGEPHDGCGVCVNCKKGLYNLCYNYGKPERGHHHYGFVYPGAYAEYQVYNEKALTVIPPELPFHEAALIDTAAVSLHGIKRVGITPGGTVCILGPGPIGLTALLIVKAMGAGRIIMVGRRNRLETAKELGAECIDFEKTDPIQEVLRLTEGRGADEVIEAAGTASTFEQTFELVKPGGKIAILGVPPADTKASLTVRKFVHKELLLSGSRGSPNVYPEVIKMIQNGSLALGSLVSHRFPLSEFTRAMEVFTKRLENVVKVIVEP